MKQIFCISAILVLLLACGKDNFETKPQIKIISVNTNEVRHNTPLVITMEFTDKEGDVSDSIFIVRQRLNVNGRVLKDPLPYKIPDFPKTMKGEFEINFNFQFGLTVGLDPIRIPGSTPLRNEMDTLRLKFIAKDKGGNFSDTATLDDIFVERL